MAFEKKKKSLNELDTMYWQIFKFYLLLVAGFYFIFFLPGEAKQASGELVISAEIGLNMVQKSMFLVMALLLHLVQPSEYSREGAANTLMKTNVLAMFLSGNLLGLMLCALAWWKLPKHLSPEQQAELETPRIKLSKQWLIGLAIVATIVIIGTTIGFLKIRS